MKIYEKLKLLTRWFYKSSEETQSVNYHGNVATYGGGGYFLDLSDNKTIASQMLKELEDHNWIDIGTRAVFIDFTLYNANVDVMVITK